MNYADSSSFSKGIFVMTLDTELAWGMLDKPLSLIANRKYFRETRSVIDGIIQLLEKYQISATWAIVGSLLLDHPNFDEELIKDITKNLDEDIKKEYFNLLEEERLWHAEDILTKIQSCSIYQEIGSHSFSHLIFNDEEVTKDKAINDFRNGMEILKQYGEEPISFIFPRNEINYLEELEEEGFLIYRGVEPSWYSNAPGKMKKICHMIDQTFAITPPLVTPTYNNGLINIPASMLYLSMDGFRKYIPLQSRVKKARKGIRKASEEKKIFHLWFHPFNIASNKEKLFEGLEEIFKEVSAQRNEGKLDVMTMREVAELL